MYNIALFLGNIGSMGGTERMTISLANILSDLGYNVYLLSAMPFEKPFFEPNKTIKVIELNGGNPYTTNRVKSFLVIPSMVIAMKKFCKKNKIDILIASDADLSLFSIPVKFFNKDLKVIIWEHNNYLNQFGSKRRQLGRNYAKRYADVVVTLTNKDKMLYMADGKSKTRIQPISNFLNASSDQVSTLNNKIVIGVGQFLRQKGFDILVDVWKIIKENKISEGWILKLAGGKGDRKERMKQFIEEQKLSDSIFLEEARPDISDLYLESSIFVLSSRHEGLPLVLLEAENFGVPTVAFEINTGPSDIITNGENGFLIPIEDKDTNANRSEKEKLAMSDAILKLMENEELRKTMGAKAKINSKRFEKSIIIKQWEKLFDDLMNK